MLNIVINSNLIFVLMHQLVHFLLTILNILCIISFKGPTMFHPYNQNYSTEEIDLLLYKIKSCVENNNYIISQNENRQENIDFINEYNLRTENQKSILMKIKTNDFCYSVQNTNIGYENEVLYVFAPQVNLINADGNIETVDVYIKFNIIELPSGLRTIVISFHKRNKPIDYLFR